MQYPAETFQTSTLLNGAPVDLIMAISRDWDETGENVNAYLWAVIFDGVDIMPVLDHAAVLGLESDGLAAMASK